MIKEVPMLRLRSA